MNCFSNAKIFRKPELLRPEELVTPSCERRKNIRATIFQELSLIVVGIMARQWPGQPLTVMTRFCNLYLTWLISCNFEGVVQTISFDHLLSKIMPLV